MSAAQLLDDLMASFAPPGTAERCKATAANPANSANHKQPCGLSAGFVVCEGLRKPANSQLELVALSPDSQEFAAVRKVQNGLESEQACGFSQNSQDSQGLSEPRQAGSMPFRVDRDGLMRRLLWR
jgi:hypothetical protein